MFFLTSIMPMDTAASPANKTPLPLQRPSYFRVQWQVLAVIVFLLAAIIGYQHYWAYQTITSYEQLQLLTQSRVLSKNIEHQLVNADLTLQEIVNDLPTLAESHLNHHLKVLSDAMPGVRTLLILDAKGKAVASSREDLLGKDFNSRDYYQKPRHQGDATALYVSPPFTSVLGVVVLNLTRIIPGPDGSFNGVVTASLDPEYFDVLLSSVRYAPDMTCAITHADGQGFMMQPERPERAATNLNETGSYFARHAASNKRENLFVGKSVSTGEENMMAVQSVRLSAVKMDKPLYIFVSRDLDAVYADWYRQLPGSGLFFLVLCFALIAGLRFLQRRQLVLENHEQQTRELIKVRLSLLEYATLHDMQELLRLGLDEVCRLSRSPICFYHFVESDQQTLSLQAWSTRTLAEFCTADGDGRHYPVADAGVWADCVRQRRPIIHNDYASLPNRKGLPQGHAPVIRELVVPILRADKVVAILGVGNKPSSYTEQDVELVTYLADVVWDITERKRSEEEKYKLGLRYQTLQAVSRDGIHILDEHGNLVESNGAFRRMLGYADADDPRLNVADWDAGIPQEQLGAKVRELIKESSVFQTRHRRRDGSVFDVEVNASGVQLDGAWYIYASSRDISKRELMAGALRAAHQFQADIFDFLPDATFVVDLDGKVIAWNKAMEKMSGVPKDEMLGQGDFAYSIPFYGERRNQLLALIDLDDKELAAKYQDVTRQGDRLYAETFCPALYNGKGAYVWAVVAPLFGGDGKRIGAIESIRDITAIKMIEANLARSNRELEEFAYVTSHDLQEPLRKITGFTELLAKRCQGTLDEKAQSYMEYIVDGSARMRTLINDLLSYSRVMRSNRKFVETDCAAVLSRVLQDMELAIKESHAEIVCGQLPVILAHQSQLGQLFQNLIGNAIKYRGPAPPKITVEAVRQRDHWLFSVADNGMGIAPEFHERIFVIFQRLHTRVEYPGTGIGLAVCQKIVELHGGTIWVESTVGTGSIFYFTIPITLSDERIPT